MIGSRSLTWSRHDGPDGQESFLLEPDHPNHLTNMCAMSALERAVLRAHLTTVLATLDIADERVGPL